MSGLFFHDLGVLDHCDPAALGHFAFQRDRLAAILSQLIVYRLVFADDQVRFAVAKDPGRTAALDAFCPARLPMFLAHAVVIDVAHHIDYFACHFFGRSRVVAVLVFLRDRQRRACQPCNEDRSYRNSQDGRFVIR